MTQICTVYVHYMDTIWPGTQMTLVLVRLKAVFWFKGKPRSTEETKRFQVACKHYVFSGFHVEITLRCMLLLSWSFWHISFQPSLLVVDVFPNFQFGGSHVIVRRRVQGGRFPFWLVPMDPSTSWENCTLSAFQAPTWIHREYIFLRGWNHQLAGLDMWAGKFAHTHFGSQGCPSGVNGEHLKLLLQWWNLGLKRPWTLGK